MKVLYLLVVYAARSTCIGFMLRTQTRSVGTLLSSTPSAPEESPSKINEARCAIKRKRWGIDNQNHDEYLFNHEMHTLGNAGFFGALHAVFAPMVMRMIDELAYDSVRLRETVARELANTITRSKARVVDLYCGVGVSTRALQKAFPDAETLIGVDTSPEMISVANFVADIQYKLRAVKQFIVQQFLSLNDSISSTGVSMQHVYTRARHAIVKYNCANSENANLPDRSFDLVTVMYALHEAPPAGRERVLSEARRLLQTGGVLALIDVSPDYQSSSNGFAGKANVEDYQGSILRQLQMVKGFTGVTFKSIVPGHVGIWLLQRI